MIKELKDFLFRGSVIDLAVAVIIGAAFGAIITSLVDDIITPLILSPVLSALQLEKISELTWHGATYGNFLAAVINFIIVGTVMFFIVKAANKALPKEEAVEEPAGPTSEELLAEIRDLLAKK